jgi:hypothetical protein
MDGVSNDVHFLDLTELAARIRTRERSALAVTRALLDRIAFIDERQLRPGIGGGRDGAGPDCRG